VLVLSNAVSMHPCPSALLRRFTSRAEDGVQILAHLKKAVVGLFKRRALLTIFGTEYDTCKTLGKYPTRSAPNSAPAHETSRPIDESHRVVVCNPVVPSVPGAVPGGPLRSAWNMKRSNLLLTV
jgi:hypothetical protein